MSTTTNNIVIMKHRSVGATTSMTMMDWAGMQVHLVREYDSLDEIALADFESMERAFGPKPRKMKEEEAFRQDMNPSISSDVYLRIRSLSPDLAKERVLLFIDPKGDRYFISEIRDPNGYAISPQVIYSKMDFEAILKKAADEKEKMNLIFFMNHG